MISILFFFCQRSLQFVQERKSIATNQTSWVSFLILFIEEWWLEFLYLPYLLFLIYGYPAKRSGRGRARRTTNPSPSPENHVERIFIWYLDETILSYLSIAEYNRYSGFNVSFSQRISQVFWKFFLVILCKRSSLDRMRFAKNQCLQWVPRRDRQIIN